MNRIMRAFLTNEVMNFEQTLTVTVPQKIARHESKCIAGAIKTCIVYNANAPGENV